MGLINKLKDVLFEEEIIEVEEKPKKKKEKRIKPKKEEKPIAKKIVLPSKNKKIESIEEEELIDEDFEIRPKDENKNSDEFIVKNESTKEFLVMDDNDFKMDEDINYDKVDEPVLLDKDIDIPIMEEKQRITNNYDEVSLYGKKNDDYDIPEYGGYEKETERRKGTFRPSPIISPIYGVLDKNYRKDEIQEKKEVRLTSTYSRGNVSIEDIRKKAYGSLSDDIESNLEGNYSEENDYIKRRKESKHIEEEEKHDEMIDIRKEEAKPIVDDITVGDADEYFNDLGLEYNVDYMDSKRKTKPKKQEEIVDDIIESVKEEDAQIREEAEHDENVQELDLDTDDNLFDLIDSMYEDKKGE